MNIAGKDMSDIPTPENAEHALIFVKWWKEFLLGIGAILGIWGAVKKGQKVPIISTLTPDQIEKAIHIKLKLCKNDIKNDMREELHSSLADLKEDMLSRIDLMIKASK